MGPFFRFLLCLVLCSSLFGDDVESLFRDLLTVEQINCDKEYRYPVTYDYLMEGGYFVMPSALAAKSGEVGVGYTCLPPYWLASGRLQLFDFLEVTGNYRVFKGVADPVLSPMGFGDFADKGANVKLILMRPEDSNFVLPGIALGCQDFIGTKSFQSKYAVATYVMPQWDLEVSAGWGFDRIKGIFGGMAWYPFWKCGCSYLRDFSIQAEYDHTDYKDDPHPKGRKRTNHINMGVKWRLWDSIDLAASSIRGRDWAFSLSTHYNFGETCGFVPKIHDPLPYKIDPIRVNPGDREAICQFASALQCQGMELFQGWVCCSEKTGRTIHLHVSNNRWRLLWDVRTRLNPIIASLTPPDIEGVVVVVETEGLAVQAFHYRRPFIEEFADQRMGECEFNLLTPISEVGCKNLCCSSLIYSKRRSLYELSVRPYYDTFFGSARGKFKYAIGVNPEIDGYLWNDLYYDVSMVYIFNSSMDNLLSIDRLNPSQIINVHTDILRYYRKRTLRFERAYVQKSLNVGHGCYLRVAGGNFEDAYGGAACEFLYYPVNSCFAIGFEAAVLRKRTLAGLGYCDKVRKLSGFTPTFQKFQGFQWFVDGYYDWQDAQVDMRVSAGQFLAKDKGVRFELGRYFPSGLRVYFWYTRTDANDRINSERYFDKGIGFTMPLDIFYTCSSKQKFGHSMSAWLRDVGYRSETGRRLYDTIHEERR